MVRRLRMKIGAMRFSLRWMRRLLLAYIVLSTIAGINCQVSVAQVRYPVHGTVQVLPPYGLYYAIINNHQPKISADPEISLKVI